MHDQLTVACSQSSNAVRRHAMHHHALPCSAMQCTPARPSSEDLHCSRVVHCNFTCRHEPRGNAPQCIPSACIPTATPWQRTPTPPEQPRLHRCAGAAARCSATLNPPANRCPCAHSVVYRVAWRGVAIWRTAARECTQCTAAVDSAWLKCMLHAPNSHSRRAAAALAMRTAEHSIRAAQSRAGVRRRRGPPGRHPPHPPID